MLDGLADETYRIDILDFATRAKRLSRPAHRNIDVGPQITFLHVPVAGAEVTQDRTQLGDVSLCLVRRSKIWLGHDLHQSDTGAVEVDKGKRWMAVVQTLAGILLEMKAFNADGNAVTVLKIDRHRPFADDRRFVLADLVALRKIGIEIILPVENRFEIDLCFETEPGAYCLPYAFFVDHGQHTGH